MSALLFQSPICLPCYCVAQAVRSCSDPDPPKPPKPAAPAAPAAAASYASVRVAPAVPGLYMALRAPLGAGIDRE